MTDLTPTRYTILDPVDELAEIQSQMERLKARAEELRMGFITQAELPRVGQRHRVEVKVQKALIFDAALLPPEIRNDNRFLRTRVTKVVKTAPIDTAGDAMRAALERWELAGAH